MLKPAETTKIISQVVDKISRDFRPEKIVLFGSYAKGTQRYGSDIDLLVVRSSDLRRDERDKEMRRSLRDIKFPLDIFVYTPQEVAEYSCLKGSFISAIFKEGRVLYERNRLSPSKGRRVVKEGRQRPANRTPLSGGYSNLLLR